MTNIPESLIETIQSPQQTIIITPHDNPDGDALGAAIGLYYLLKNIHPSASIHLFITPSAQEEVLDFMDAYKCTETIGPDTSIPTICQTADTWYVVDVAVTEKLGKLKTAFENTTAKRICIDHHHNLPAKEFEVLHIDSSAAACSLLVWELWKYFQLQDALEPHMANALYGGIISDTGGWLHSNTESRGMHAGAELLDHGVTMERIRKGLRTKKIAYFKLFSRVLDRLEVIPINNIQVGISHMLRSDLQELELTENDTDGMIGDFLLMKELSAMFCLIEKPNDEVRLRSRSREGTIDLLEFCRTFGGGGHINASGAKFIGKTLYETKALIKQQLTLSFK